MTDTEQHYSFCRLSFWNGYTACASDEEWTECKVTPIGKYHYGEQTFGNTSSDIHKRDALIAFLSKAYESGRSDAKREIREALGVKP